MKSEGWEYKADMSRVFCSTEILATSRESFPHLEWRELLKFVGEMAELKGAVGSLRKWFKLDQRLLFS